MVQQLKIIDGDGHIFEDGEAIAEARLDLANLLGIALRGQAIHGERGHDDGSEAHRHHHR